MQQMMEDMHDQIDIMDDFQMFPQNENWNQNNFLNQRRIRQIADKIPEIIFKESPTVQMYLALHNDDVGELKKP